jgi:2-polyprenylphenol 6-hydroxylase
MPTRKPPTILIAGAGTVGLATAALIATSRVAERVRVHVFDARPLPERSPGSVDLRVYALSRASQSVCEQLGVWATIAPRACPYRRMRVWEGDLPEGPAALDFDSAEIGEPDLGHIVEDAVLREALASVLAAQTNAEITTGAALADIVQSGHGVEARLGDGGALRGTLLVAADGSESAVRKRLDLPALGHAYGQTALVTHVATERAHAHTAWQRFLPGGPLAFLPLFDGRSSVVWSLPTADAERLLAAPDEALVAELQTASAGVLGTLGPVAARGGFPLRALHALKYCRARVALIGDAAHTVHPLAGQGMNLGLLDAACLAAVIEAAIEAGEDPGDLKVLRRYERERKGDNLEMLLAFDGLNRLFRLPAWAAPVRAAGLFAVERSGTAKRLFMRRALGLTARGQKRLRYPHVLAQS